MIINIPVGSTKSLFSVVKIVMLFFDCNGNITDTKCLGFAVVSDDGTFEYYAGIEEAKKRADELNDDQFTPTGPTGRG
jgi:hypothetical protein